MMKPEFFLGPYSYMCTFVSEPNARHIPNSQQGIPASCNVAEHYSDPYITVFYGTDNILQNFSSFSLNVRNILYNIVSPIENC